MRVINTFRAWKIQINEIYFLGDRPKVDALVHLKPQIFMDDRHEHVERAASSVPSAHVLQQAVAEQMPVFEDIDAVAPRKRRTKRPVSSPAGRKRPAAKTPQPMPKSFVVASEVPASEVPHEREATSPVDDRREPEPDALARRSAQ